jgi:hypothetical protein
MTKTLPEILPVLQVAIGPVILISGIGLLLLSLTNRFARILDRARVLARDLESSQVGQRERLHRLAVLLRRRAIWNRRSIVLASLSILFVALLIILIFIQALAGIQSALPIICVFSLCLVSLVGSVVAFLWDNHLSALTLHVELGDGATGPESTNNAVGKS